MADKLLTFDIPSELQSAFENTKKGLIEWSAASLLFEEHFAAHWGCQNLAHLSSQLMHSLQASTRTHKPLLKLHAFTFTVLNCKTVSSASKLASASTFSLTMKHGPATRLACKPKTQSSIFML